VRKLRDINLCWLLVIQIVPCADSIANSSHLKNIDIKSYAKSIRGVMAVSEPDISTKVASSRVSAVMSQRLLEDVLTSA